MTKSLRNTLSLLLCFVMLCGVMRINTTTIAPNTSLAEAPVETKSEPTEAATAPPTAPPTEKPTAAPLPDATPEPTVAATPADASSPAAETPKPQDAGLPADSVSSVPDHAYLRLAMLPEGLSVIGLRKQIKTVVIPASVESIPVVSIGKGAFEDSDEVERVTVEKGLITIGKEAFKNCNALMQIDLPETVTEIASDAFDGCSLLTVINTPEACYARDFATAWLSQHIPASAVTASTQLEPTETSVQPEQPEPSVSPEGDATVAEGTVPESDINLQIPQAEQAAISADTASVPDTDPQAALLIGGNTVIGVGTSATFTAAIQSTVYTARDIVLWSLDDTTAATLKTSGNTATIVAKAASAEPVALTATLQKDDSITSTVYLSILSLATKATITAESGRKILDINEPTDSVQMSAKVTPDTASQTVTWKSSNSSIAAVDTGGLVTVGSKTGTAIISATTMDGSKKTGVYPITVCKALTDFALLGPAVVGIGRTLKPTLAFSPVDATNKVLIWASSNPVIASVSTAGLVKGISSGTATITATSKGNPSLTADWIVTVSPAVSKMSLTDWGTIDLSSEAPFEKQLSLTIEPATASTAVVWSSSKPTVAIVDDNGLVTATGVAGSTTIKASVTDGSNKSTSAIITAAHLPTGITVTGSSTIVAGKSAPLRATVAPATASQAVIWTSSNKAIATVDAKGVVKASATATKDTKVTITAASTVNRACTATWEMTVAAQVDNFTIIGARNIDMLSDTSLTLTAETSASVPVSVLWSSSNPKIATVDASGTVKPLMAGAVAITAMAADGSSKKATENINIVSRVTGIASTGGDAVTLALGRSLKLNAVVIPATALSADRILVWKSDDPSTVSVSAGTIRALKLTPASEPVAVTATTAGTDDDGGTVSYTFSVTVTPVTTGLTITKAPNQSYINLNSEQTTLQLAAVVLPAAACQSVLWQTSNAAVASVDESGLVTGLAPGKVTITAASQDASQKKATLTLMVFGGAQSIAIKGPESIRGGLSAAYAAAVKPSAVSQAVVWSIQADTVPVAVGGKTTQQSVASISSTGIVKTIAVPELKQATITAKAKDDGLIMSTLTLAVLPMSTRVSIEAARSIVSTNPVSALQLTVKVEPVAAGQAVTWHSSDAGIATVSDSGVVTGKRIGNAIITATATDGSKACAHKWIGVGESVQALEIVGPGDLGTGTEADFTIRTTPSDVAIPDVLWESGNESLATVDARGHVVIAESIESETESVEIRAVSVENPEVSTVWTVTIHPVVEEINISPNTRQYIDFSTGVGSLQLNATVSPSAAFGTLSWSSSDESVATVAGDGFVTAHHIGSVTVTATALDYSSLSASVEVRVVIPVTGISISGPSVLGGGCSAQLTAEVVPSNATETVIVWSLQDDNCPASIEATGRLSADVVADSIQIQAVATVHGVTDVSAVYDIMLYPATQNLSLPSEPVYFDLNSSDTQYEIQPSIQPSNAYQCFDWSSSNNLIAAVDTNGLVTAQGAGVATITAMTKDGTRLTCQASVRVEKPDFSYTNYSEDLLLTGYLKQPVPENVIMPDQIMGRSVVAMNEGLFMNATGLKNIHISRGITAIPADTFNGCTNLTEVWLSDNVTDFGDRCFNGCVKIQVMQTYTEGFVP